LNLFRDGVAGAFFAVIAADLAGLWTHQNTTDFSLVEKGKLWETQKKEHKKFPDPDDKIICLKQIC